MTKLDESTIIKIFQKKIRDKKFVSEDVEIINIGKTKLVAKVDTLVQSTDIPPKMNLSDAARKSMVACVSDFAAKGVKPQFGLISLNLPRSISYSRINKIADGFKLASDEFNILILGGDTNEGKEIVINVCVFGVTDKIVNRKGAKPGDLIFVTGPFGYTAAGLEILLRQKKGNLDTVRKSIRSLFHPIPRLNFGMKNRRYFTSAMDSSDGLSTTLNEMANQSRCKFVIRNYPTENNLVEFANFNKIILENLVFHGGEEYEIVFTISKKHKSLIKKSALLLKTPIIEIGCVARGSGVFLEKNNKQVSLKDFGWHHFKK